MRRLTLRRVLAHGVVVALAGALMAVVPTASASAAEPPCDWGAGWTYIRAGDDGYLKPDASGYVHANGDKNVDPWNQQFVRSRYPSWPGGWEAFRSNLTGKYLAPDPESLQLHANHELTDPEDLVAVWLVIWYDPNFSFLQSGGLCAHPGTSACPYAQTRKDLPPYPVVANAYVPSGWTLFRFQH